MKKKISKEQYGIITSVIPKHQQYAAYKNYGIYWNSGKFSINFPRGFLSGKFTSKQYKSIWKIIRYSNEIGFNTHGSAKKFIDWFDPQIREMYIQLHEHGKEIVLKKHYRGWSDRKLASHIKKIKNAEREAQKFLYVKGGEQEYRFLMGTKVAALRQ